MTRDQFWEIVDGVHEASVGDMATKCKLLAEELRKLPPEEVQSFEEHFTECWYRAFTEDLWGAAYLIKGGCSDDKFMDFRSTLISMGRKIFENALADPDYLADVDLDRELVTYQGYQYVTSKVYQAITGRELSEIVSHSHPKEPFGTPFEEWAMSSRYPKLAAKYGWKDSDHLYLKDQREKAERRRQEAERLASLLLDSGIIPSSGVIPPLRVLKRVLRSGQSPPETGKQFSWEPFELEEDIYWPAMMLLNKIKDSGRWPELRPIRLRSDLQAPPGDDYAAWMNSLGERGLA